MSPNPCKSPITTPNSADCWRSAGPFCCSLRGTEQPESAQLIHCSNRERGLALIPFGEPLDFRDPILKCLPKAQSQASMFSIRYQVIQRPGIFFQSVLKGSIPGARRYSSTDLISSAPPPSQHYGFNLQNFAWYCELGTDCKHIHSNSYPNNERINYNDVLSTHRTVMLQNAKGLFLLYWHI